MCEEKHWRTWEAQFVPRFCSEVSEANGNDRRTDDELGVRSAHSTQRAGEPLTRGRG